MMCDYSALDAALRDLPDKELGAQMVAVAATRDGLAAQGHHKAADLHGVLAYLLNRERLRRQQEVKDLDAALGKTEAWWGE